MDERFAKFAGERENYPALRGQVYLDYASSGLISRTGFQAMQAYMSARLERGLSYGDYVANWRFADALRGDIGRMIGCDGQDIAYGYNASQLLNIFVNGLALRAGDNIVTTELGYDAGRYTLLHKRADGVEIRFARAVDYATPPESIFALTDERTRAVVLSHVEHGAGFRHDLGRIGAFCRARGIYLAVDATQSCGAMRIDVERMGVDFLAASCYKWMQSFLGQGFAYVSGPLRRVLRLSDTGWTGERDRFHGGFEPCPSDTASRYECGGLNFAAQRSLKVSVDDYLRLGGEDIQDYILSLHDYFRRQARSLRRVRVLGDFAPANRSSIVTLSVPAGVSDETAAQAGFRVHCARPGRMRVGFHYCTAREEIDRLLEYLESLR